MSSPPLPEMIGGGLQRDPVAVAGEGERGEGILLGINE